MLYVNVASLNSMRWSIESQCRSWRISDERVPRGRAWLAATLASVFWTRWRRLIFFWVVPKRRE